MNDAPEVLFVCVHNAGRSHLAAAGEANRPWPRPRTFPGLRHGGSRNRSIPVDRALVSSRPVLGP